MHLGVLGSLLGFNIRVAQVIIYNDFMRGAPISGLTPGQLAILLLIESNPNITQQTLADGIGAEKSTLVVRLHRLEERGLVERVRSDTDRRHKWLRLTREGQTALKKMLEFVTRHEKKISARLSSAERAKLIELLRKVG
jgi:DNA-binding MarR family transcriptional regulator